jgi:Putative transposase/Transposase zinc-binding domain
MGTKARPALELADIFRRHGSGWRAAHRGHISLGQLRVMSAIEHCRTAALGGHVAACENSACGHSHIAYNSCRNRHCPKCQGAAAREWMGAREAELLPVQYFHLVFTIPAVLADIAYQNKAVIYDLLFKASAETMLRIAADPKHLGARIGFIPVLHSWGSAMTHHPHVHMIVPGGGLSADGRRWIACRRGFFLPVLVLSKLFRRLMLGKLAAAYKAGKLRFYGEHAHLSGADAFARFLAPLRKTKWFVYSKRPFSGPKSVLSYLARYTHRVAISNRRLVAADENSVTFTFKDYRIEGPGRYKTMTLAAEEFIRRFLLHILPKGFHRIRHYGFLAANTRAENLAIVRALIAMTSPLPQVNAASKLDTASEPAERCPHCGGRMLIALRFEGACRPRKAPSPARRFDTS